MLESPSSNLVFSASTSSLTRSQQNATRKKHPELIEYLPPNELLSESLCFAGQVLPVLARPGLLDVREREGGRGRLHCPGGLHHTQILYSIRKCFHLLSMTKLFFCAPEDPKVQLLFGASRFLPSICKCCVLVSICVQQASEAAKTPRPVTQLHFTSWPDFGVPFSPIGMLKFLKKVKAINPPFAGPIAVHCRYSAEPSACFLARAPSQA